MPGRSPPLSARRRRPCAVTGSSPRVGSIVIWSETQGRRRCMDSPSWGEIERAMAAVLELPERERMAWLSQQPAAIRNEVQSLLAAYHRSGDFLGNETAGQTAGPDLSGRMEAILAWIKSAAAAADSAPSPGGWPMALVAGTQLGPYRIDRLLGKGGMGEVFRGTDTRLGRPVAIKISTQQFSGGFEREARAISALNHPHISTLYDVGTLPSGAGYLVT